MLKLPKYTSAWIPLIVLGVIYLVSRLVSLLTIPLFTDESIYIYWAKVIATTHAQFFISLTDGKPPVLIWLISLLLSIFPNDWYLLAGRLPSVFAGLIALIAIIKLGELLFSKRVGLIAGVLYIIFPMTLFYDRMALFDGMLNAMLLAAVYFAVKTGRTRRLNDALLWGVFLGLAFLSKPTALLFLPLTVLAAGACLPISAVKKHIKRITLLSVLALIISEGMNNVQRISSAYPAMLRKNEQFQQPIAELLQHPFALTIGNLQGFFTWTLGYYTIPFFVLGLAAFLIGIRQKTREIGLLFLLWFLPLFILATVGREVFPRYIFIVVPYFLLMGAYGVDRLLSLKNHTYRYVGYSVIVIISLPLLWFDGLLLTNPVKAPLPVADANQYILEHPSGYGLEETYAFFNQAAKKGKVVIVTQGTFGLYPYAYYLEYWGNPDMAVLPKWPLDTLDKEIIDAQKKGKVYVVLKEHDSVPQNLPLREVFRAEKPGGKYPIIVTELK